MSRSQPFTPLGCSVTSSFPSLPLRGHSPSAFEYSIKGRERSNAGKDDGEGAVNASGLELRAKTPLGSEQLCWRGRPRARTSPGCPPDGCWEARGCVRFIPLCVSVSLPCLSGGVGLLGTETLSPRGPLATAALLSGWREEAPPGLCCLGRSRRGLGTD